MCRSNNLVLTAGVALTLLLLSESLRAQTVIDDFTVNQTALFIFPCPGAPQSSTVAGGLGGERQLTIECNAAGGPTTASVGAGLLVFGAGLTADSSAVVQWDGVDGSANLDPIGLGGVDLTVGGQNTLRVRVSTDPNPVTLTVEVYTDGSNASSCAVAIPPSSDADFGFGFPGFTPDCTFSAFIGSGATFSNVGAIQLILDGTGGTTLDAAIDFIRTDAGAVPVELQTFSVE